MLSRILFSNVRDGLCIAVFLPVLTPCYCCQIKVWVFWEQLFPPLLFRTDFVGTFNDRSGALAEHWLLLRYHKLICMFVGKIYYMVCQLEEYVMSIKLPKMEEA